MVYFEWEKSMSGLKNVVVWCGICVSVLMLNACASAVFPDFADDEDEVSVSEGGRVEKELPKEGNSLKADKTNAAYEDEDEEPVDEMTDGAEEVSAAKTTPVHSDDKVNSDSASSVQLTENEEISGPSVSYRVETIYFANGSSSVSSEYNKAIRDAVKMAKQNNASIIVYGYASSRTRNTDAASHKLANFKVSMARAESVAAALKRAGMPAAKIYTEALSDTAPAYLEVMPEGERLNRRAEIYLTY